MTIHWSGAATRARVACSTRPSATPPTPTPTRTSAPICGAASTGRPGSARRTAPRSVRPAVARAVRREPDSPAGRAAQRGTASRNPRTVQAASTRATTGQLPGARDLGGRCGVRQQRRTKPLRHPPEREDRGDLLDRHGQRGDREDRSGGEQQCHRGQHDQRQRLARVGQHGADGRAQRHDGEQPERGDPQQRQPVARPRGGNARPPAARDPPGAGPGCRPPRRPPAGTWR